MRYQALWGMASKFAVLRTQTHWMYQRAKRRTFRQFDHRRPGHSRPSARGHDWPSRLKAQLALMANSQYAHLILRCNESIQGYIA